MVGQLSDLDVTESQTLNYTLENLDLAKARAVEDAYHKAREEALTLARTSGRSLARRTCYASVDVQLIGMPSPMPMMAARAMSAPATPAPTAEFAAHKITVTARVNALFLLK